MENRARFSDALWSKELKKIIVGGAGGIGSWVCLYLTRIGHSLYVYDFDNVERVNMAGQFFSQLNIGTPKTVAIQNNCLSFSATGLTTYNVKYDEKSPANPFMFSCFDNMKARKIMFNNWKKLFIETQNPNMLFVDGRMTAELGHVYFVTPNVDVVKRYEETLFEDSEGADLPCSFKSTTHNGAMIASIMVSGFNNYLFNNHESIMDEVRQVPFEVKYFLDSLTFNVK